MNEENHLQRGEGIEDAVSGSWSGSEGERIVEVKDIIEIRVPRDWAARPEDATEFRGYMRMLYGAQPLFLCTAIFNRYDLLNELFRSVDASTVQPSAIFVVDHGYNMAMLTHLRTIVTPQIYVLTFEDAGVAHAANWLISNLPDDRVCVADDIKLAPETLEKMRDTLGDFVTVDSDDPRWGLNAFSCYILRDTCARLVGTFDEHLSPGYLYYEDTDYRRRMSFVEDRLIIAKPFGGAVSHHEGGSNTIKQLTAEQMAEHHRRFTIASRNYARKWGGMPGSETRRDPLDLSIERGES